MAEDLVAVEEQMDVRIAALEQQMKQQCEEMQKEIEALTKANQVLSIENETLRVEVVTPTTPLPNVILRPNTTTRGIPRRNEGRKPETSIQKEMHQANKVGRQ